MISFDDFEDEDYVEDSLEDLIEYVIEYLDPNYRYKDFVLKRLINLEGDYERTDAAVTYFERTDLNNRKWKFCYNLVIPVVIPPEEHMDDEEESRMVKTLMLDIMRNTDLIEDNRPQLDGDNISTDTIQIGGFEVFWLGMPHIRVSLG